MKKTGRIGWCSTIPRPWCSGRRRRDETPMSLLCLDWGSLLTDGMQSGLCPHFIHSPVSEFLNGIHSESWVSTLQYRTMHSECPSIVFKFILKTSCISLVAFFSFCFFFSFFLSCFFFSLSRCKCGSFCNCSWVGTTPMECELTFLVNYKRPKLIPVLRGRGWVDAKLHVYI